MMQDFNLSEKMGYSGKGLDFLKQTTMRVDIKTKTPVKDPDIKALYIINEGMKKSTARMREANLRFVAESYGFTIKKKQP